MSMSDLQLLQIQVQVVAQWRTSRPPSPAGVRAPTWRRWGWAPWWDRREDDGTMTIVATLDKMARVRRTCAVCGWTLFYDDGTTPLPFTEEALLALPSDVADFLDREISRV